MTTYNYTGAVQTVNLPAGRYLFELYGAEGYQRGGKGGFCSGEFTFAEETEIHIFVGGKPTGITGGYNGGGNGNNAMGGGDGGGGGGATDIRVGGTALSDRIIVAAGGGGGSSWAGIGGAGGGLVGSDGTEGATGYGTGGTQTSGGTVDGALGIGGNAVSWKWDAGGGGGGYHGGGGSSGALGGGGGGSSYFGDAENGVTTPNVNEGHGYAVITQLGGGESPANVFFAQII